jgi:hypothetical protein
LLVHGLGEFTRIVGQRIVEDLAITVWWRYVNVRRSYVQSAEHFKIAEKKSIA